MYVHVCRYLKFLRFLFAHPILAVDMQWILFQLHAIDDKYDEHGMTSQRSTLFMIEPAVYINVHVRQDYGIHDNHYDT